MSQTQQSNKSSVFICTDLSREVLRSCLVRAASPCLFFFFKQKTAYEMRISDWSSDVCSSDLPHPAQKLSPSTASQSPPPGRPATSPSSPPPSPAPRTCPRPDRKSVV